MEIQGTYIPDFYLFQSEFIKMLSVAKKIASGKTPTSIHSYLTDVIQSLCTMIDSPIMEEVYRKGENIGISDIEEIFDQLAYPVIQDIYSKNIQPMLHISLNDNQSLYVEHLDPTIYPEFEILRTAIKKMDETVFKTAFSLPSQKWLVRFFSILSDLEICSDDMKMLCYLLTYSHGITKVISQKCTKLLKPFYEGLFHGTKTSLHGFENHLKAHLTVVMIHYGSYIRISQIQTKFAEMLFQDSESYKIFRSIFFLSNKKIQNKRASSGISDPFTIHRTLLTLLFREGNNKVLEKLREYMMQIPGILPQWQYAEIFSEEDEDFVLIHSGSKSNRAEMLRILEKVSPEYCQKILYMNALTLESYKNVTVPKEFLSLFPLEIHISGNHLLQIKITNNTCVIFCEKSVIEETGFHFPSLRLNTYQMAQRLVKGIFDFGPRKYFSILTTFTDEQKHGFRLCLQAYQSVQYELFLNILVKRVSPECRDEFLRLAQEKLRSLSM